MQPCCISRDRSQGQANLPTPSAIPHEGRLEHHLLALPHARHESKAPQKDLQIRADLDQQRSEFLILKAAVEELTSQFVKMGKKMKKLDDTSARLVKEDKEKSNKLFDLDGRLHDFHLSLSRGNTDISRGDTLASDAKSDWELPNIASEPVASNARGLIVEEATEVEMLLKGADTSGGIDFSHQIDDLKAEIAKMIAWRSEVTKEFENLHSSNRELAEFVRARADGKTSGQEASFDDEAEIIDVVDEKANMPHFHTHNELYGRKFPLPGEVKSDKESVEHAVHLHREYTWEESVYDALFLINVPFITKTHSALLFVAFMMNLIVQTLMVLNINTPQFTDPPFEEIDSLRIWRNTEAHSYLNTNSVTGVPLVVRVCNMERGLSVATSQRDAVATIDTYLTPLVGFPEQGRVLCTIAIFAWYLCCAMEIRTTVNFLIALLYLPRSHETAFAVQAEGFSFVTISSGRFILGWVIACTRLIFACVLFFCGARWIAYEVNVVDLLLNASALAFVLEVDNYIFAIAMPFRIIGLMRTMMPVRLPKSKALIVVPLSLIFCSFLFVIIVNVWILDSNVSAMKKALAIMCEPESSQHYIIGQNPLGWVTWTKTIDPESRTEDEHIQEVVGTLLRGPEAYPGMGFHSESYESIVQVSSMSLSQFVSEPKYGCNNNNGIRIGMGNRLWALTANESLLNIKDCDGMAQFCGKFDSLGRNARFMCPCTCGCADIHAGLWTLSKAEYGCPAIQCKRKVDLVLSGQTARCGSHVLPAVPCTDGSMTQLDQVGWHTLLRRMQRFGDISLAEYQNLTTMGCAGLKYLAVNPRLTICSMREPVSSFGIAPFCPEACECAIATAYGLPTDCPGLCPNSCCMRSAHTLPI